MNITLLDRIRFAMAPSYARRDALKTAMIVIGLLLALGIVGRMDYEDQLVAEKMAAEQRYAVQQAALLACLNNGAPGYYTIDDQGHRHYIVCETYTVSDQHVKARKL